ncbi:hypothetical protein GCM10010440_78270 [Kitasatospora cinereorecta]
MSLLEVELPIGCGGVKSYQIQTNSECYADMDGSEALGAKVQGREGKNPDHQLRSPNVV